MKKYLLNLAIIVSMLNFSVKGWGQTTIFTETMGTVAGTTTIAAHETANGFDNDGYTMSQGGATMPADIRVTTPSTGYTGASGAGNVWFTTTNNQYGFAIEGIDASAYTSLTLDYGYYKNSGTVHATFAVEYWNGSAWVSVASTAATLFNEAAGGATGWYSAKTLSLPVGAQILGLKIRFLKSGINSIKIDDVILKGTASATPTITSFAPASGCVGSSVVITGTNFSGATAVTIGGTAVTSYTVDLSTQITAVVATGTTGTIAVTTAGGTGTSAGTFTINPLPTISGTLSTTIGGTTTLSGSATAHATTPWSSATQAVATITSGGVVTGVSAGSSVITYMNTNGCIITATVNISAGAPTVTSFAPTSGCVGSSVVITGTNFTGATAVTIGGTAVTSFTVDNATQITAVVATGTTGTIAVTTAGGTGTSASTFTINPLPTITGTLSVAIAATTTLSGSATAHATTPWASATPSVATITSGGVVTGVSVGTSVITYMNTNGCTNTATVTVTGGACTPPTTQATWVAPTPITSTGITVKWTRGNGNAVIVVARASGAVDTDPTNGTTYTANATFGLGTEIGTGNYVVYSGTGTSVPVTGLTGSATYYFAIYEYSTTGICYHLTEATGNATTTAPAATLGKILFDATKAETASNADWVMDADIWNLKYSSTPANYGAVSCCTGAEANAQRYPTPATPTAETDWTGGLSSFGYAIYQLGYTVETLPWNVPITYGDATNPQDLSNYAVYVMCEPNKLLTTAEKTAVLNYVNAGGGLYMLADHGGDGVTTFPSDRNNDGVSSLDVFNDLMTGNIFGMYFEPLSYESEITTKIVADATDPLLHNAAVGGDITGHKVNGSADITLNAAGNATVKGIIYKQSATLGGTSNCYVAYCTYGSGRVVGMGDSSPAEDVTSDPGDITYEGWTSPAAPHLGDNGHLIMNATVWLAAPPPQIVASPTTLTGINYAFGAGPSTPKSFLVSASNLSGTGNITVTGSTNYEVCLTVGGTYAASVTLPFASGIITGQAKTVYVRLKTGLALGNYNSEIIAISGGGATTVNVTCSGSVTSTTPTLSVAPTSQTGYAYIDGSGPSVAKTITLSGVVLNGSQVSVAGSTNFEVSLDGTTFSASVNVPYTAPTLSSTTVYIRLKTGLIVGSYGPENVSFTDNGGTPAAVVNVANSGTVTAIGSGSLFISEFAGYGSGATPSNNEYIELTNTSGASINLSGWTLEYYNSTTLEKTWSLTGTIINNDAYVVALRTANTLTPDLYVAPDASMNSVGYVVLKQGTTIMDEAGSLTTKFSDAKNYEFTDCTNDNKPVANWVDNGTGAGTPGVVNCLVASPTITISSTSAAFGNQCVGVLYAEQTYNVSGTNLSTNNIVVTPPTGFEISTGTGASFVATNPITLTPVSGTVAITPIYVRFAPASTIAYSGNITHVCTGATTKNNALTGTGVNPVPTITTPTSASIATTTVTLGATLADEGCTSVVEEGIYYSTTAGFTDGTGTKVSVTPGPYYADLFTIPVTGLTANTVYYYKGFATNTPGAGYSAQGTFTTIHNAPVVGTCSGATSASIVANWTAPAAAGSATFTYTVEVDDDPAFASIDYTQSSIASGTLSATATGLLSITTYYYRVKAVNAGGSSAWSSNSAGCPTLAPTPTLAVAPTSLTGFTYVEGAGPSTNQTYNLSGSYLTGAPGNITVTAPTDYEVCLTSGGTYTASVNVAYATATLSATAIYVRLKAGLTNAASPYNAENVTNAGGGATTVNVACSGTVTAASSSCLTEGFDAGTTDPAGWANSSAYYNATAMRTGTNGAGMNATADWIRTSLISTNPQTLTFWGKASGATSSFTITVATSPDNTVWTDQTSFIADGANGGSITSAFTQKTVTLNLTGTYYIRWYMTRTSGSFYFDDVDVTCGSTSPTLTASPTSLTGFTYAEGSGPSANQSYNLSGTNLTGSPGNIVVTGPTDYLVCLTSGGTYTTSVNVAYASATLSATPIYVKLKSGLTSAASPYNSENITNAGGGATTINVACSGTVTVPDVTPPTVTTYSPLDGSTTVITTDNLVLTFNENVVVGTAGNIVIYNSDGSVFETIPWNDARITYNGTTGVTINPTLDLVATNSYYIQISATAIRDVALNNYAGIADNTTWNFTVTAVTPANIFISEYAGYGFGGVTTNEYFELSNIGGTSQNVSTWTIEYHTATATTEPWPAVTITLTGSIAANSAYLIAANSGATTINGVTPNFIMPAGVSINETGYFIVKDGSGVIVDQVGTNSTDEFPATNNYEFTNCGGDNLAVSGWVNLGTGNGTPGVVNCACTYPATQANSFSTANITGVSMDVSWARPSGDGVIVVARVTSAVNADPTSGTTYTGNASFGSGTQIGTGNYVVYAGTGTSVSVSNLAVGTTYHFAIYAYNTASMCYNLIQLTGNATTLCTAPATQANTISFSGVGAFTTTATWVRGNGVGVVVVAKAGVAVDANPVDGTTYTGSATFGSGTQIGTGNYVIYTGTGTSVALTNLLENTTYHYRAYEYNCSGASIIYSTVTATGNPNSQLTNVAVPTLTPTPTSLTALDYNLGSGPSVAQSFSLSGVDLSAGPITITAPTNFLVCATVGGTYVSSYTIAYTAPILNATNVYVKLAGGLAVNTYTGNVTCAGGSATTVNVSVSGAVVPVANITITGTTPIVLGSICEDEDGLSPYPKSTPQIIHVLGEYLTAPLVIDFSFTSVKLEVSEDNITYYTANTTSSLSITPISNTVDKDIYLRISATSAGSLSGSMYFNSTGASQTVSFSGTINAYTYIGSPSDVTAAEGTNATFTITDPTGVTFQWQQKEPFPSTTWVNLAGATSNSLTMYNVSLGMDQYKYQVIATNASGCPYTSSFSGLLTVTGAGTSSCGAQPFNAGATQPLSYTFTNISSDAGNFGAATPALLMDATGDKVETWTVTAPSVMSFYIMGLGTMTGSSLLVEGFNGYSWQTIENITSLSTSPTTKTYTTASHSINNYSKFKYTFTKGGSSANLVFDDVDITCGTETTAWLLDESFDNVTSIADINAIAPNLTDVPGWTASESGGGLITGETIEVRYNRGGYALKFTGTVGATTTITSPTFANADLLSFYWSYPGNGDLVIESSTSAKASWVALTTIATSPSYGRVYFIPLTTDIVRLRFTYTRGSTGYAYLDDIRIRDASKGGNARTDLKILQTLVQSCGGDEGVNELVIFKTGAKSVKVSNLSVSFPTGGGSGSEYSMDASQKFVSSPTYITRLNDLVHITDATCSPALAPPSGIIPSDSYAIIFTGRNPSFTYDLKDACTSGLTYYVINCDNTNTVGKYGNNPAAGDLAYTSLIDKSTGSYDTQYYDDAISNTTGATVEYDATSTAIPAPRKYKYSCEIVLPVELLSFTAKCEGNNIKISWTTASETNNDYFTLEKSYNMVNWNTFATLKGAENSNTKITYNYIDPSESNITVYYRLKQTDYNGEYEYFDPAVVMCDSERNELFNLSPNPTKSELKCEFYYTSENKAYVEIINAYGQVLVAQSYELQKGLNNMDFDLSNFSNGIYYFKIYTQDGRINKIKKFIKQ